MERKVEVVLGAERRGEGGGRVVGGKIKMRGRKEGREGRGKGRGGCKGYNGGL